MARFLSNENEWKEFKKTAKEIGFLSGSECLRQRVREVNEIVRKRDKTQIGDSNVN